MGFIDRILGRNGGNGDGDEGQDRTMESKIAKSLKKLEVIGNVDVSSTSREEAEGVKARVAKRKNGKGNKNGNNGKVATATKKGEKGEKGEKEHTRKIAHEATAAAKPRPITRPIKRAIAARAGREDASQYIKEDSDVDESNVGREEKEGLAKRGFDPDEEVARRKYDAIRVQGSRQTIKPKKGAEPMGDQGDDAPVAAASSSRDYVAERLVEYTMDPDERTLPIVTITPTHAMLGLVGAETMATIPYTTYIGRDPSKRATEIARARTNQATTTLIRRRDVRAIGVKGQGRADAVSMMQIRQEAQQQKAIFNQGED